MKILQVETDCNCGMDHPHGTVWIAAPRIDAVLKSTNGRVAIMVNGEIHTIKAEYSDLLRRWQEGLGGWVIEAVSPGEIEPKADSGPN